MLRYIFLYKIWFAYNYKNSFNTECKPGCSNTKYSFLIYISILWGIQFSVSIIMIFYFQCLIKILTLNKDFIKNVKLILFVYHAFYVYFCNIICTYKILRCYINKIIYFFLYIRSLWYPQLIPVFWITTVNSLHAHTSSNSYCSLKKSFKCVF